MRLKNIRILSVFLILFLLTFCIYTQSVITGEQKDFLWKVQSKTSTVYVLGSIHFLKKDIYPLDKKIENAFDRSNILVVEANINDMNQINVEKLMGGILYPDNDTLENHVSRETYELIKKEMGRFRIPPELINKQKPWILALTLTSLKLIEMGYDPNYGIDMHFLLKAEGKKKISELESLDYQINLFADLSDKEQELFLLYTLKEINLLEQEIDKLVQAWIAGDTKGIEFIMNKDIEEDKNMEAIYEKFLYERNRNMALKIEDFLKTKDTYFVIVGAGHLVGKKGIIEILREKGYPVEQL
ncbi:MAG: TraB/GumN family protein [Nitrospirota bacterium]